jgi:signal transduction histidine kinase
VFDSMRIRSKLAIALAIPLVALAAISFVVVGDAADDAGEAADRAAAIREQVELATASLGPSGVITTLQNERNAEALALIGMEGVGGGEPAADIRGPNDEAIEEFKRTIAAKPAAVREAYEPALAALDSVAGIRESIDSYDGERALGNTIGPVVFDQYSAVITAVFDANSRVALAVDDASLRNGARIIDLATREAEINTRLVREVAFASIGGGIDSAEEITATVALRTVADNITTDLEVSATGPYVEMVTTALESPDVAAFEATIDGAMAGDTPDINAFIGEEAASGIAAFTTLTNEASTQLEADAVALRQAAESEQSDAESREQLVLTIAAAVIAIAAGITLLASRSITKPLHRLTTEAEDMAGNRLPETVRAILETPLGEDVHLPELAEVPASGGFEIAEVAKALNTVQASAAALAVEQAVLRRNISDSFVNLGRRNQNLLSRQLDSITEMERQESDPEELQKLFTLDHLATRMRRNAESLLLLAGLEPHRQWSAPVALIDVLRGALGEVEDYDRVNITRLDEVTIGGTAAADLTHLVAELLENALNFSPPGRDVEVVGAARANGGYTLAIVDSGVGMEAEDMAQANVRLAGAESFTVAPSRYLGHYVVGIQAARLGVVVQLQETTGGGVTARIDIDAVLAEEPAAAVPEAATEPAPDLAGDEIVPDRFARADEPSAVKVPDDLAGLDEVAPLAPAPAGPATGPQPDAGVTASGYKKRVRGANTPRTDVRSARVAEEAAVPTEDATSPAEGMRTLLSGFQAGTERGRAEARGDATTDGDDR